ncbi:glutamate receptor ionotropic, NMDA 1-like [Hydractinia symbiolongicarpus]|uniref:glutamate receptor ionotropic, NMDA 1-like n=1 Tax=Hydractinia symbiolongicarpus TaxID=13093 RepID=UPI00254C56A8|nr:glutamate receptor ionotropic, NMDA 1-like [Hydractinia symbiolongicarpus]XP_057314814.1 glutamate receptor ionotropic, NMDA 1-like [Hydractinia symbiolongicarpus]
MKLLRIFFLAILAYVVTAETVYQIGFLVNDNNLQNIIKERVQYYNMHHAILLGSSKINASWYNLSSNPVQATTDICEHLIRNKVYAVVTTNAYNSSSSPDIVSYACAFYNIPTIAVQARQSELSDKTLHPTLLRTVPPYSDQARVWADLIRHLKWNKVNLVTSNDYDGRITYIKFTSWAYKYSIVIEKSIMFPAGTTNLSSYLEPLNETQSKVILLACSSQDASAVYKSSHDLGITGKGYIWISNQQAVTGNALPAAPQGLLAVTLNQEKDIEGHIQDAIDVIVMTLAKLQKDKKLTAQPPASCHEPSAQWKVGETLYESLINETITGQTGSVSFDWYGDRKNPKYNLMNVVAKKGLPNYLQNVGYLVDSTDIEVNLTDILWPGNQTDVPAGVFISNHLRIVTVESRPFIYVKKMPASKNCTVLDLEKTNKNHKHVPCRGPSRDFPEEVYGREHCCTGFCIDLLRRLAKRVNFTYDLHLVEDGHFGSLKRVNGSNIKRWNGMVGEIVEGQADLIVASLTINNERAQYIEFSKPFKYQGITILVKKNTNKSSLVSFLRPFKTELWLLVLLSVHVVAVILYLLDRFSPFGRYRLAQSNKEETALNLSSAMWFSWGVLLNSGIGEGTPRSFSARVLGMVWAGFAMIIVASYTANLAAFLVLDRPKPVVSGVDDPSLRNPSDGFKYATVANSSVDAYFRRQVELSSMYTFMEKYNVETEQQGIDMVKSGDLKAFIWDSPVLFHETSQDCDVSTVGDLFGRSGYGIGMPKGSPWSNEISLAVLHFHESGTMEELESTWIDFGNCPSDSNSPTTLGLKHMLGVFIMVAAGIGAGIIIVILEVLYYKHKGWRKQQQKILKKTTEQWQEHVQDRKNRFDNSYQMNSRNGSTNENNSTQVNGNLEKNGNSVSHQNPVYETAEEQQF